MSFNFVFLIFSYLLVLLGFVALFLTEELSLPYVLLASVSFVVGVSNERTDRKGFLPEPLANIAMLGIFALTLFSIFVLKTLPLQELVHFLLALQAVKLLARKRARDWLQLYLLSFFSLLAASALSVELFFAMVFICYLFAAPLVLVLFHLKTATEAAGKDSEQESRLLSWSLFRVVGAIDIVLFCLTLGFFITFPRLGAGFFGNSWATGSAVTGFSDRLTLGEVAEIQKNNAVAMRVSMDQPKPGAGREFYWRGLALDLFDGRKWQKSRGDLVPLRRSGETYLVGEWVSDTASLIRQKIVLEPAGSQAIFALSSPVAISGRLPPLFRDPLANLQAAFPFPFQISYEVLSRPEVGWQERLPASSLVQLPDMDPRILELSRQVTEGIEDNFKRARVLEQYLRENYRYSLKNLQVGDGDPLAAFLFDIRQGNCEYFASALAIMLRGLGIPTRVVNGYLGGEWNPYGEYYLIRQSNAHSWVEAYFGDIGWITLDPTPPVPPGSRAGPFTSLDYFVDSLRMRWYRHVINFSFGDQYQLFAAMRRPDTWFGSGHRGLSLSELRKLSFAEIGWWIGLAFFLASLAIAGQRLRKMRRKRKDHSQIPNYQATERYQHLLKILRKKRLTKEPGETADEFSLRVEPDGRGVVAEFTTLYQRARFSGSEHLAKEVERMDQILMQLRK